MHKAIKKYFIPHAENNYHPHILHTKRAVFYSALFISAKMIVFLFVMLLPVEVFVLPDVLAEEQKQIIILSNQLRAEKQLTILSEAERLDLSAQKKSQDMADNGYFAHLDGDKNLAYWLKEAGYNYSTAGENLAVGFSTAEEVVEAWKNSPTHYANLIDRDYLDLGVGLSGGIYKNQPVIFIAQHLGKPSKTVAASNTTQPPVASNEASTSTKQEKSRVNKKTEDIGVSNTTNTPTEQNTSSVLAVEITTPPAELAPVMNLEAPTPMERYTQAKKTLGPLTSIFTVSKNVYLSAVIFFIIALVLNIFIKFHKQHPHIILQTSCLIVLLLCLWKF